jgi:hypothetical protein
MAIPIRLLVVGATFALLALSMAQWTPTGEAGGVINVNTTADDTDVNGN